MVGHCRMRCLCGRERSVQHLEWDNWDAVADDEIVSGALEGRERRQNPSISSVRYDDGIWRWAGSIHGVLENEIDCVIAVHEMSIAIRSTSC